MVAILEGELSESSFHKDELVPQLKTQAAHQAQTPEQVKRSVRFSPHDRIMEIPHLNDLSDDEIDDIWMSPDDFKAIQRECKAIVLMMDRKSNIPEEIELRGLEHHMLAERKEVEGLQDLMYDTVDRLMIYVDETSMDVTDILAEMCKKISVRSETRAREIAIQDEQEAIAVSKS